MNIFPIFSGKSKSFTLIELLIVIAILGILTTVVMLSLSLARARARDAIRRSDMKQLVSAQEMYYVSDEQYYSVDMAGVGGIPTIGTYLDALNDPQCQGGSCGSIPDYVWINNTDVAGLDCSDANLNADFGQWFCAYATLEAKSGANTIYVAASNRGVREVVGAAPTIDNDCTCLK